MFHPHDVTKIMPPSSEDNLSQRQGQVVKQLKTVCPQSWMVSVQRHRRPPGLATRVQRLPDLATFMTLWSPYRFSFPANIQDYILRTFWVHSANI